MCLQSMPPSKPQNDTVIKQCSFFAVHLETSNHKTTNVRSFSYCDQLGHCQGTYLVGALDIKRGISHRESCHGSSGGSWVSNHQLVDWRGSTVRRRVNRQRSSLQSCRLGVHSSMHLRSAKIIDT